MNAIYERTVPPYCFSLSLGETGESKQCEIMPHKSSKLSTFCSKALLSSAVLFICPISQIYQPVTAIPVITESSLKSSRLDLERADLSTIARIRDLSNYSDGWDGYKGKSPSKTAISDAEKFSRLLSFDQVHAPHISLASDGEINFLWMLQDFRLDLGFYGDGTYSYYGKTTNGEEFMADDQPFDKILPDQIVKLIRKKNY